MLSDLLSELAVEDVSWDNPTGWAMLREMRLREPGCELQLDVQPAADPARTDRWLVRCASMLACHFPGFNGGSELEYVDEHPLLRRYVEAWVELAFRGRATDPRKLVDDLMAVHWQHCGDWEPFRGY